MAYPDDLLDQAAHLARREPRKPRQASLRRAASAAYYALFHLLVEAAVTTIITPRLRLPLRRTFDHGPMKDTCRAFSLAQKHGAPALAPGLANIVTTPVEREIVRVALAFVDLQEYRHTADYDLSQPLNRSDALSKIDSATSAFKDWRAVATSENATVFLGALLFGRLTKR